MKNFINSKNINFFFLIIVIIGGIFLRFYNYNLQDFWWDELMEFKAPLPADFKEIVSQLET